MKTIVLLFTLSMVVCFTLCTNEDRTREDDPDEFLKEIVHREKRDAKQESKGIHTFF